MKQTMDIIDCLKEVLMAANDATRLYPVMATSIRIYVPKNDRHTPINLVAVAHAVPVSR